MFEKIKESVIIGHILLIISCILYSVSWIVNYGLLNSNTGILSGILILTALFLGFTGAVLIILGISKSAESSKKKIKYWHIILFNFTLYLIVYFLTSNLFNRFFTSEILLMFIWLTLESCSVYYIYLKKYLSGFLLAVSIVLMSVSILLCSICYTIHYNLPEFQRFINGLLPYCAVIITMSLIVLFTFTRKN
jgi:hypothetical protein